MEISIQYSNILHSVWTTSLVKLELEISTYLNYLFGESWVYHISFMENDTNYNSNEFYVFKILSFDQIDTKSVFKLQSMYQASKLQIHAEIAQFLFNDTVSNITDNVKFLSNNVSSVQMIQCQETVTSDDSLSKITIGITSAAGALLISACCILLLYQWYIITKLQYDIEPETLIPHTKTNPNTYTKSKSKSKYLKAITTEPETGIAEPESATNSGIKIVNMEESIRINPEPTTSGKTHNDDEINDHDHQKQPNYPMHSPIVPVPVAVDNDESVYVSTIQVIKKLTTITNTIEQEHDHYHYHCVTIHEREHEHDDDGEHQRNSSTFTKGDKQIDHVLDVAVDKNNVIEYKNFKQQFKLVKLIGKGSFGRVYKGLHEGNEVAVKIFNQLDETHFMEIEQKIEANLCKSKEIYSEIILATSIPPHPNIIRINGFSRKPLCVVMEYMAGGSVQRLVYGLSHKPIPSIAEKLIILIKACYGFGKLTEYGLHHRDIAARNILLGQYDDEINGYTKVKITDFGMTRENKENDKILKTSTDGGPYKWMAPESIMKQQYNEQTDVYMFGKL